MDRTSLIDQKRAGAETRIAQQIVTHPIPQRCRQLFNNIPTHAHELQRINRDRGMGAATGGTTLAAGQLPSLRGLATNCFADPGIGDPIRFQQQRQPGLTRFGEWKTQARRRSGSFNRQFANGHTVPKNKRT